MPGKQPNQYESQVLVPHLSYKTKNNNKKEKERLIVRQAAYKLTQKIK